MSKLLISPRTETVGRIIKRERTHRRGECTRIAPDTFTDLWSGATVVNNFGQIDVSDNTIVLLTNGELTSTHRRPSKAVDRHYRSDGGVGEAAVSVAISEL